MDSVRTGVLTRAKKCTHNYCVTFVPGPFSLWAERADGANDGDDGAADDNHAEDDNDKVGVCSGTTAIAPGKKQVLTGRPSIKVKTLLLHQSESQ